MKCVYTTTFLRDFTTYLIKVNEKSGKWCYLNDFKVKVYIFEHNKVKIKLSLFKIKIILNWWYVNFEFCSFLNGYKKIQLLLIIHIFKEEESENW